MPKFALRKIDAIIGRQSFYELLINGKSQYEEFTHQVKRNPQYYSELKSLLTYMNLVANLNMLPKTKFRDITSLKYLLGI